MSHPSAICALSPDISLQLAIPLCPPLSIALNGSAIELYKSDSYYDDLLWAAGWMYKASGALLFPCLCAFPG